jgi:hypothetical protein
MRPVQGVAINVPVMTIRTFPCRALTASHSSSCFILGPRSGADRSVAAWDHTTLEAAKLSTVYVA